MGKQNSQFKRLVAFSVKELRLLRNSFLRHKFLYLFLTFSFLLVCGMGVKISKNLKDISKSTRRSHKFLTKYRPDLSNDPPAKESSKLPLFCGNLKRVPLGDEVGLVKNVKTLSISGVQAPYNASIIESENNEYLLFFRYDLLGDVKIASKIKKPYRTYIASVKLDREFNQIGSPTVINTESDFSEDPRVVQIEGDYFLVYNDLEQGTPVECRTMRVACLNKQDLKVKYRLNLDLNFQILEKNWVPFVHQDSTQNPQLYFGYSISPHKILKLNNLKQNLMTGFVFPNKVALQNLKWNGKWGHPRGGTPARLVDGEYLAFFHSSFKDAKSMMFYYVMGAYTFENHPPFRITRISKFPITFKSMYDTPYANTASLSKRVIFPSGYVIEKKEGKEWIHISCGENDSGVKIVTLDKEALFKYLEPVSSEKNNSGNSF